MNQERIIDGGAQMNKISVKDRATKTQLAPTMAYPIKPEGINQWMSQIGVR
jgi:hypothetical protein